MTTVSERGRSIQSLCCQTHAVTRGARTLHKVKVLRGTSFHFGAPESPLVACVCDFVTLYQRSAAIRISFSASRKLFLSAPTASSPSSSLLLRQQPSSTEDHRNSGRDFFFLFPHWLLHITNYWKNEKKKYISGYLSYKFTCLTRRGYRGSEHSPRSRPTMLANPAQYAAKKRKKPVQKM